MDLYAPLNEKLAVFLRHHPEMGEVVANFRNFIAESPNAFDSHAPRGHITGSAFILSPDCQDILLSHHAKLKIWVQMGGHADGCPRIEEVALREAWEESGLHELEFYPDAIPIDLDIHEFPERKGQAAHLHFDVRFLLKAKTRDYICSEESLELRWVPINQIPLFNSEVGMKRAINTITAMIGTKL